MNSYQNRKKFAWIPAFFLLAACPALAQSDALQNMTAAKWQLDLDFLTEVTHREFALFTRESKQLFTEKAAKLKGQLPRLTTEQTVVEFARIMALLREGHTELQLFSADLGFRRLPLVLYYFGHDMRVIAADKNYEDLLGAKLLQIGNTPVEQVYELVTPVISADNPTEYYYRVPQHILLPELLHVLSIIDDPSSVPVTLSLPSGEKRTLDIRTVPAPTFASTEFVYARNKIATPLYHQNREDPNNRHWYTYLDEAQAMYYRIVGFGTGKEESLSKRKPGNSSRRWTVCRAEN